MIKKQDQRISDLKKLMQRELKIAPPLLGDDDLTVTGQTTMSGRSLSHHRNSSSVSVDSISAVGIHTSATPSSLPQSGLSVTSVNDVRNGGSVTVDLAEMYKSATCQATNLPSSPATLDISDQLAVNGQHTPTINSGSSRSVRGQRSGHGGHRSQAGVVMSPADCDYDFVRELNFRYLRHVVLKFMLSREAEVMTD